MPRVTLIYDQPLHFWKALIYFSIIICLCISIFLFHIWCKTFRTSQISYLTWNLILKPEQKTCLNLAQEKPRLLSMFIINFRRSYQRGSVKKDVLKIFVVSQESKLLLLYLVADFTHYSHIWKSSSLLLLKAYAT